MKLTIVYVAKKNPCMGLAVEQIEENGMLFDGDAGWLQSTEPVGIGQQFITKTPLTLVDRNGFMKWTR